MIKKWATVALKITISVALVWFLLSKVDFIAVKDRILQVAPDMLILATVVMLFQVAICAIRWNAVLKAIAAPLPLLEAARLFYIGSFFNQALPSAVGGDAIRMYKAYRGGMPFVTAFNGVMLERVATVAALILMVLVTQPFFLPRIGEAEAAWILPTVGLAGLAMVGGIVALMMLDRLPSSLRRWRVVRGLATLASDTRRVFLAPVSLVRTMGWSLIGHFNVTLSVYVMAVGLDLNVSLIDCLALFPPVLLITTLPISIAGWGVREGSMVVAFALIDVPKDGSLALSLLFGFIAIIVSIPGGIIWLADRGREPALNTTPLAPGKADAPGQ